MKFILNNHQPLLITNPVSKPLISMNALNGLDIGIPLNIFSNIYTNLHYGYDITSTQSILLQFLLGYYTYGKDRYNDALDFNNNPFETSKEEFYNFLYENKEFYNVSLNLSFFAMIFILFNDYSSNEILYNLPFIPLFYINGEYKYYKKKLNIYKPLYISLMWTIATIILPCVLYENNYNIINYPQDYLPCMLTLFATSNFADSKDIIEDKFNNITTIPVKYGLKISNTISFIAIVFSAILLIENPNFEKRIIINSLVELQNIGTMALLYNDTFLHH
tara:strand:+ start:739 stop:1569 length:831 start_codon:yes stop_codon:yes gene_type:complete